MCRPCTKGGKHTVFLVNTVALVTQQSIYIARLIGLTCGEFSVDKNVDFLTKDIWEKQLEENQVIEIHYILCYFYKCYRYRVKLIVIYT